MLASLSLYDGDAVGLISNNIVASATWDFEENGIEFTPQYRNLGDDFVIDEHYDWEQTVFLLSNTAGRATILPEISASVLGDVGLFYDYVDLSVTGDGQSIGYQPTDRISNAYISERVQQVYPPLQNLD